METRLDEEWRVIEELLPVGWEAAARECKAFRRVRRMAHPGTLLRLLLFHAVNGGGLRATVAQARARGIAQLSQVALFKRLKSAGDWLAWIGATLCTQLRGELDVPEGMRVRVVDSTTVQGPAAKSTGWRLHYALDLRTLSCDWYELTDARGGELLERTPMRAGDVLMGDRNYFRAQGIRAAIEAQAHVLIRLRWRHAAMRDARGRDFRALDLAKRLRVGQVGEWPVQLDLGQGDSVFGRVISIRLPATLAHTAQKRARRHARKKHHVLDRRTILATHFVMLFTTLPPEKLDACSILELYRHRWQIELTFKRLKQLIHLGRLPHKDPQAARGWILAKLVVALLLDSLYRNARAISPWGFELRRRVPLPATIN